MKAKMLKTKNMHILRLNPLEVFCQLVHKIQIKGDHLNGKLN